jgi:hypothetical protein
MSKASSGSSRPAAQTLLAAVAIFAFAMPSFGQSPDQAPPKRPPEVYVPASDLDAILGIHKRGVLLPRSQFEELLKKAEENARATPDVPNGITVASADYQGRIVASQLLLGATIKLNQVAEGWRSLRLPLAGVAIESAVLDGKPALLGANGAGGTLHLFSERRGGHTLVLELSAPLTASGGDREAAFRLGDLSVGTLHLEVAPQQRLLIGGRSLERPSPLDKPATYSLPVGGPEEIKLRLTDRSLTQASDRLLFGITVYRLDVSFGDAAWQATTTLDARGSAIEKLAIAIPEGLRITAVESTGLDSWKASAATPQKPPTLELSYREPFKGTRTIQFHGVVRPGADRRWRVEALKIEGVTAHIGRIEITHPSDLRLRIESVRNLRTGAISSQPTTAGIPARSAALLYDAWNEQFSLTFGVEGKERQVLADLLTSIEVGSSGLELQLAASLESLYSPLFDVELTLPAEWTPTTVLVAGQRVDWRELSAEAGIQHLLITLPKPAAPGARMTITLGAQKSVSTWPIDETGIEIALPEIRVLNSAAVAGSYVVRAGDDFELTPSDVKGLDPAHLNLERERMGYRYQDTRFSGKLKIARRPARLSAETTVVARLDRAALRTRVRTTVEARGGGVRRLDIFLPEAVNKDVRFRTEPGEAAITDQTVSEPTRGERHWTLNFERYVQGTLHLTAHIDIPRVNTPRGEAKEFAVPEPRLEGVARHSGVIIVQAAPDQQLGITAAGADKQPLAEVDQADLPALADKTDDRTVAAYRFVQPGSRVTLTETRYAPVGVARAVCTRCDIQTMVSLTGECQHAAAFQFQATGVQGLRLALPEGTNLWATLVDGKPVEVRKGQHGYELPLAPGANPDDTRTLSLFYATPAANAAKASDENAHPNEGEESAGGVAALRAEPNARFQEPPPEVSVVGSGGTSERMEVLHRAWTLNFPSDLAVAQSVGAFRPASTWADGGLLGQLIQNLSTVSAVDVGLRLLEFLAVVVVTWLCVRGYSRWGAAGIVTACVAVGVIAVLWLSTLVVSAPENRGATKFEAKSVATTAEEPLEHAYKMNQKPVAAPAPAPPKDDRGFTEFEATPRAAKRGGELAPPQAPRAPVPVQSPASGQARLSVAMGFEPQQNSSQRAFEYIGRESADGQPPVLDVEFENLAGRRAFGALIVAIVTLLLWIVRRRSWAVKGPLGALGLLLPIALAGVAPIRFEVWLAAIFLGTLCGIAAWLIYRLPIAAAGLTRRVGVGGGVKGAGAALLLAGLLMAPSSACADDNDAPNSKVSRPAIAVHSQPSQIVIPYDADHDPLAAQRVLLEQRAFVELWSRAHPDRPLGSPLLPEAFVTEATYKAHVVSDPDSGKTGAANSDRGQVAVAGHIVLYSRLEHAVKVALPVRQAALKSAKLDGQPALLIPHSDETAKKPAAWQYDVVLNSPGIHLLDIGFDLSARVAGPSGEFTLSLLPVASGRLSFELPQGASTVRINGADSGFRTRSEAAKEWIDVPIATPGEQTARDLTVSWQPAQEAGSVARTIESIAKTLFVLEDAGLTSVSQFSLSVRQGSVSEVSFALPANSKLKDVRGGDVAGWKLEGNDPARKLVVALRHKVSGETQVALDLFQPLEIGESLSSISSGLPEALGTVRQSGTVALAIGPQFDARTPSVPGATQIDPREFDLPGFYTTGGLQSGPPEPIEAAFRYASRPAAVVIGVGRRSSQIDVTALYAILVSRRKLTLSSQFHVRPTGSAVTRAQFRLPADFLPLAVEGAPIGDWYTSGVAGAKSLVVELAAPQSAPFDLIINGTVAKNPDDAKTSLDVPILSAARSGQSHLAVWLDGSYQATIGESADWKSVAPDQVPAEMKALLATPPQFAFATRKSEPAAISLNLSHAAPRLAGDSATIITVTDSAVFYTVALQWTIGQATADTFELTMPDWLAASLDLTDSQTAKAGNPRRRQTISTPLGNGRVRWTIELTDPVADQLFLTATAVLPLPKDGKIAAPFFGFEHETSGDGERRLAPLATQRHFLVLVNQSTGQLSESPGNAIEPVERGALPLQLDQNLLKQAMLVGRLTRNDAVASWRLDRPAVRRGAAAFVNLADLVTVIEPGGSWRTQATYRVKNLSRQFLAIEIPDRSEILSVIVRQKPARAVRASVGGKTLNLIPLPEVSEGDLSFDVQTVVAGHLADGPLPEGVRLVADKVALVAPQVVTGESDSEYGIPVARTRWTVWLPTSQQVRVLTAAQDTNLDQADEGSATIFERSALLDEARQLLSVAESGRNDKSAQQARYNLRQLDKVLTSQSSSTVSAGNKSPASQVEQQNEQSVLQRMQVVREKDQRGQDQSGKKTAPTDNAFTPEAQKAQAKDVLQLNEGFKMARKSKPTAERGQFGFQAPQETGVLTDKKPGRRFRGTFGPQDKSGESRDEDNSDDIPISDSKKAADLEKQFDALAQKSAASLNGLDGVNRQTISGAAPLGQFGAPIFTGGKGQQGQAPAVPAENPQAGEQRPEEEVSRPHSPGTLSLAFAIPTEGQRLVFTKAGGDPRLAVELRPKRSIELALGVIWMLPWLFLLFVVIALIRRSGSTARRQFAIALIAVGLLLFVYLPIPAFLVGLLFVVAGTIQASIARTQRAATP